MSVDGERLLGLLPSVYRVRDAELGKPLAALLAIVASELDVVEADIDALYDNWFIETCDEWVVPYIGDLLGVRGILPVGDGTFTQRGLVANTIAYRRAKGTAAVLEDLARDVTDWPARAVEFFEHVVASQHVNHVRAAAAATPDLHDPDALELVGGPFERACHVAEVRHVDNGRGRYDIPYVGVYVWRLQQYELTRVRAHAVAGPPGRYTFDVLGQDARLFDVPRDASDLTGLATERDVPAPLRRRPLHAELEARRQAHVLTPTTEADVSRGGYFEEEREVLRVFVGGNEVPPREIAICDLSDPPYPLAEGWRRPPATTDAVYGPPGGPLTAAPITVGVDPVLGRLAFPLGAAIAAPVEVSYAYGFAGDLGAGPYDRRESLAAELPDPTVVGFQRGVSKTPPPAEPRIKTTLAAAVADWHAQPPGVTGVISIMDDATYDESVTIRIPAGSTLVLLAADWRELHDATVLTGKRRFEGRGLVPDGLRPHVQGDLTIVGTAPAGALDPGNAAVDGLLLQGVMRVAAGNLGTLRVAHTTVVPDTGTVTIDGGTSAADANDALDVSVVRSIVGAVSVAETAAGLVVDDSIVDGHGAASAIAAPATEISRATVLGRVDVRSLDASNSIFSEPVSVTRRQSGCVRFSYVTLDSRVPRRYRCLPADTASAARVVPAFASTSYSDPHYAMLAVDGPEEIATGSDVEAELGAYAFLQQRQRLTNLRFHLDEYLRFGLEAGVFFAT